MIRYFIYKEVTKYNLNVCTILEIFGVKLGKVFDIERDNNMRFGYIHHFIFFYLLDIIFDTERFFDAI